MPRGTVDWAACEAEYRAGTFSNRQLAGKYGCTEAAIRDRAKRYGWEKDLSAEVRRATNAKLLRRDLRDPDAKTDRQIVDEAADARIEVIHLHRKDVAKLREIEQSLLMELQGEPVMDADGKIISMKWPGKLYLAQYKGEIVEKEVGLTVSERAGALRDLSTVQHKRIQLERQAYSLNDVEPETQILIELD